MELYDGLITRRSIRAFKPDPIDREQVDEIIRAGMYAPSAVNCQPWHFIVIDDRSLMDRIMQIHPYAGMLAEAQYAVLICGDQNLEHGPGYWVVDCGAATQNMLLAAHAKGVGSVWLGLHPREKRKEGIRELFELPGHIQPFALIALGYPNEQKPVPERFKKERIHYNRW
ncbi:MAG: nitroreductase family protein [Bacteroidales bacterium]|nr:nitroreductase family protein [Bacteroidales bacterium]